MTTIINTPQPKEDSDGGMGMIIGLVIVVFVTFLFFVYGLPAQINVPSEIDVNINQEK